MAVTRDGYDRTAAPYAERFHQHLDGKPVGLAALAVFAGLIAKGPNHAVVDVGCETGATTAILAKCGLTVSGLDVSSNIVGHAQRLNPDLSFMVGSMTSLAAGDSSVGAVCAWHSIIHIPDEHLAAVFEEFHRVVVLGLYRRVGWKRGSWHDVAWTQLDLLGPAYHSDSPIPIN